jgi:hypothetical protein
LIIKLPWGLYIFNNDRTLVDIMMIERIFIHEKQKHNVKYIANQVRGYSNRYAEIGQLCSIYVSIFVFILRLVNYLSSAYWFSTHLKNILQKLLDQDESRKLKQMIGFKNSLIFDTKPTSDGRVWYCIYLFCIGTLFVWLHSNVYLHTWMSSQEHYISNCMYVAAK